MFSKVKHCKTSILPILLVALLTAGCGDDSAGPQQPQVVGSLIGHSDCGGFTVSKTLSEGVLPDQSAIIWEWDGKGKLILLHRNGAFNCCPNISCDITFDDDIITVTEKDSGMCDCLCLTDVEYHVTALAPGTYNIKFVELNLIEGDEKLDFNVTLGNEPQTDTVIVERDHYPWLPVTVHVGTMVSVSDCGGFATAAYLSDFPDSPDDSACITWEYDSTGVLWLTHENFVANCCLDSLIGAVGVSGDTIHLQVTEYNPSCFCICPYDIEMKLENLPPRLYLAHMPRATDTVRFWVNLTDELTGYSCYGETVWDPEPGTE